MNSPSESSEKQRSKDDAKFLFKNRYYDKLHSQVKIQTTRNVQYSVKQSNEFKM